MTNTVRALVMSLTAGLSTLLGALAVFIMHKKSEKMLAVSLGFAGGVMISVSFSDLLPSAQLALSGVTGKRMGALLSIVFVIFGLILAALLDKFVPHQEFDQGEGEKPHNNLFHVGFVSMLAIALHNFPEGIATFMSGYDNVTLGISITVAIALHNIPEGISVAMPIYYATGSRKKAFRYTFLAGIAEPLGALIAFLFLRPFLGPFLLGIILACITGIMLYIAIEELLPSSRQYGHNRAALISVFAGICVMLGSGMIG